MVGDPTTKIEPEDNSELSDSINDLGKILDGRRENFVPKKQPTNPSRIISMVGNAIKNGLDVVKIDLGTPDKRNIDVALREINIKYGTLYGLKFKTKSLSQVEIRINFNK